MGTNVQNAVLAGRITIAVSAMTGALIVIHPAVQFNLYGKPEGLRLHINYGKSSLKQNNKPYP